MPQKRSGGAAADDEAERLKEQNRVHQKQFRERRKEKFKLLEERVAELERELSLSVTRQSGSVSSSSVYVTPPIQSDDPVLVLGSNSRARWCRCRCRY
ncbi:hypothetical protein BCR33DRAFT_169830 [Rhizoclosmatium globosum]|uniref:BZIP domain-containing protein n=1 Tax=Rhizoclosmatium globosum TaxID=329046 RepID=A0A1Y2CEU4_9FUNG|nr:hypothetical protein BCR33DRAFT_169830 [Rhizoclosmatium globosum]|eukprot:ORY45532.1 hypothetical protein BCR33DRAFT_169830 [Rhizoclosmatium globosum]